MKEPVVYVCDDKNQHSFWLLYQQGFLLIYYHPTYSSSLFTKIVTGDYPVPAKTKKPHIYPVLSVSRTGQERAGLRGRDKQGVQEATPGCMEIELSIAPRRCSQEGKKTELWGQPSSRAHWYKCVVNVLIRSFPLRLESTQHPRRHPESLDTCKWRQLESEEGAESWEEGSSHIPSAPLM